MGYLLTNGLGAQRRVTNVYGVAAGRSMCDSQSAIAAHTQSHQKLDAVAVSTEASLMVDRPVIIAGSAPDTTFVAAWRGGDER